MRSIYLNLIPFAEALRREEAAFRELREGAEGLVLGFESEPVITLGVRASDEDLRWSPAEIAQRGFRVTRLDRGGQATLHNPGQLVIFPILAIRDLGARRWVDLLLSTTRETLRALGCESVCRAGQPGLFTARGKVVSLGVRVKNGISTHGLAINVANEIGDFSGIRACGVADAAVDRVGTEHALDAVFALWLNNFKEAYASSLTQAGPISDFVCSS